MVAKPCQWLSISKNICCVDRTFVCFIVIHQLVNKMGKVKSEVFMVYECHKILGRLYNNICFSPMFSSSGLIPTMKPMQVSKMMTFRTKLKHQIN